jgi:hypothetical protein
MNTFLLRTVFGVRRGKKLTTNSVFSSRSFAPARAKGAAQQVSGGTPKSLCSSFPRKSASASATLALAAPVSPATPRRCYVNTSTNILKTRSEQERR